MANEFVIRDGFISLGGVTLPYVAKTATYTIAQKDYFIDCSGTFTVTLPTAVGFKGKIYIVKNSGDGSITLATTSSQTIDVFLQNLLHNIKVSKSRVMELIGL